MTLKLYNEKRDFRKTAEPKGRRATGNKSFRFVIQKHAASRLHYDFRLELEGVLKSWAVPKGLPYAHGEKRLAVHVEDHPLSYIEFEGIIPKGQYGGGTVMVWDKGTFEPLTKTPMKELASGKLHFLLSGKKLTGEWYLVRLRDDKQWLIIRKGEDLKPISRKADDTSALSGRTMQQLAGSKKVWHSNRPAQDEVRSSKLRPSVSRTTRRAPADAMPQFVEPMRALLVRTPPQGDWIYEVKFDGFRALGLKGPETRLMSRNEKDLGGKFPEVRDAIAQLKVRDAILDGEIVALDARGRSSFQLLQAFELGEEHPPLFYYAFDLLRLNGHDLRRYPLARRKAELEKLLAHVEDTIRFSPSFEGSPEKLLKQAGRLGLEGLIAKRKDSVYESARRSGAWVKLKILREQEFVIGGYSNPEGSRSHFGALLIGVYEGTELKFSGKVGTGFNEALLASLYAEFRKIHRERSPFVNLPEKRKDRHGSGITAAEMKRCHWVEPTLVCQIKFSEWTRDGKLRQPVFLGLREDKDPSEVAREEPV